MNKRELLLFLLIFFSFLYFFHSPPYHNINSRLDLVYAMVDKGTFVIDDYHQNTIDKAFFKGQYYSDKAPGLSLFGALLYRFLKLLTKGHSLSPEMVRYLIRIFTISLPSALLGLLFYRFLGHFTKKEALKITLTLGYSLGTLAFIYSTLFYGHQLATTLAFSAFCLVFINKTLLKNGYLALSGFLMGYALITEYSTGIIYLLLLVYLWGSLISKKRIGYFLLGSSAPVLFLLFYNYTCFGHLLTSGYAYEVIPFFREGMRGGFMGLTRPSLYSLFLITFSPARGIFWLSPFLLLSFPGLYHFFRSKEYRREFFLFSGIIAGYLLFNCSYYLPGGGWAPGPRHLVPMLPFLCASSIFALKRQSIIFRKIFVSLILLSLLFIFLVVSTSPHVPPVFTNTLFEFSLPLFLKGQLAQNGGMLLGIPEVLSLLPLLLLLGILFFLLRKGLPKRRKEKERKGSLINFLICLGIILLVGVMAQIGVQEKTAKYHFLGVVYQDKNQLCEAKEEYEKALDMEPNFYLSYNQLAAIYFKEGKESEAIEMWRKSLKIKPNQPRIQAIIESYGG